jgi:3-oxoacyl-[acyl-carrier protein] reductase
VTGVPEGSLKSKTALVTGAAQGIGKAIALRLAREGAVVAACDMNLPLAEATVQEIRDSGAKAKAFLLNVTDAEAVERVVEEAAKEFGRIDILVNNAGITKDALLLRMEEEAWDAVLSVNLKGTFLLSKACARLMIKQRFGRIVNISSVSGQRGNAGQSNYAASKAGIIGFTKSLSKELGARGVTVNAVAPGFIRTAMTEDLPQEIKDSYLKQIPLGRLGTPEDVAGAVAFLCSEDGAYISGEILAVNGGMH